VLGLIAAAIVRTAAAAIGGTVGVVLVQGSQAPALTIWHHWMTSNVSGIVAVAPLLIELASAARDPPPGSEIIESAAALAALTALSGFIIDQATEAAKMSKLLTPFPIQVLNK
jgi:integral membrane sensor domain MASE1